MQMKFTTHFVRTMFSYHKGMPIPIGIPNNKVKETIR